VLERLDAETLPQPLTGALAAYQHRGVARQVPDPIRDGLERLPRNRG
jgi:hypothetical protein